MVDRKRESDPVTHGRRARVKKSFADGTARIRDVALSVRRCLSLRKILANAKNGQRCKRSSQLSRRPLSWPPCSFARLASPYSPRRVWKGRRDKTAK